MQSSRCFFLLHVHIIVICSTASIILDQREGIPLSDYSLSFTSTMPVSQPRLLTYRIGFKKDIGSSIGLTFCGSHVKAIVEGGHIWDFNNLRMKNKVALGDKIIQLNGEPAVVDVTLAGRLQKLTMVTMTFERVLVPSQ